MSEMVDRVLDVLHSYGFLANERDVRLVLEAMREPTAAMCRIEVGVAGLGIDCDDACDVWQAMIDKALST